MPGKTLGATLRVLLAVCLTLELAISGCVSIDVFGRGGSAPLVESIVRGKSGPKILLVDIDGVISGAAASRSFFPIEEISMVSRVREVLDGARDDDEVHALLLRIDSPGGTVTASEQIYSEIRRFKEQRGIPVFAQLLGTAASGGYYVAMAADEVQAHPTTVTGSIGVIFSSVNVVGLMEKLGIEDQTITAGEFKDAGSPYRRLSAEERNQLQSIVDDLQARFREVVSAGRPRLTDEDVARVATGRIYSAPQALKNGLVDRIGTLEDLVGRIEAKLGTSQSRVVAYHRPAEVRRNIYMKASDLSPARAGVGGIAVTSFSVSSLGLARLLARPGFHYLWWPGLGD